MIRYGVACCIGAIFVATFRLFCYALGVPRKQEVMSELTLKHGDGCVIRLKQPKPGQPDRLSIYWYAIYRVRGKRVQVNTRLTDEQEAIKFMLKHKEKADKGGAVAKSQLVFRWENLRDMLVAHYVAKGKVLWTSNGVQSFPGRTAFDAAFKGMDVRDIDQDRIAEYIKDARSTGLADPTIKRHIVCLRRAFKLAKNAGKVSEVPYIETPGDSAPAGKPISPADVKRIIAAMPTEYQPLFQFLYYSACRVGAAMVIDWSMINTAKDEIKLPGRIIKNREGMTVPLVGGLEVVASFLKKSFRTDGPVFVSKNYREVWFEACHAVGVGVYDKAKRHFEGPRVHDLRVSAIIALIDSGISQDVVMKISGHKTVAVFSRYNILTTERTKAAMIQAAEHAAKQA
jgi:integrase